MRFIGITITRLAAAGRFAEDRRASQSNAAGPEIGETDRGNAILIRSLLRRRTKHIPAAQGVVCEIKMGIDYVHDNFFPLAPDPYLFAYIIFRMAIQ